MIRRSPCPALTHISWLLKSMKLRPSAVWKWRPLAAVTASGLSPACADQSYSVWRRQSSVISSALSALTVSVAISGDANSVDMPVTSGNGGRRPGAAARVRRQRHAVRAGDGRALRASDLRAARRQGGHHLRRPPSRLDRRQLLRTGGEAGGAARSGGRDAAARQDRRSRRGQADEKEI